MWGAAGARLTGMFHSPSAILRVSLLVLASAAALGQETRLSQREGKALVEGLHDQAMLLPVARGKIIRTGACHDK